MIVCPHGCLCWFVGNALRSGWNCFLLWRWIFFSCFCAYFPIQAWRGKENFLEKQMIYCPRLNFVPSHHLPNERRGIMISERVKKWKINSLKKNPATFSRHSWAAIRKVSISDSATFKERSRSFEYVVRWRNPARKFFLSPIFKPSSFNSSDVIENNEDKVVKFSPRNASQHDPRPFSFNHASTGFWCSDK